MHGLSAYDYLRARGFGVDNGSMNGLGQTPAPAAAPPVVRKLLQDAKGAFSNERFEELKKPLIEAYQRAEADYKRTLDAATVLNPLAPQTVKEAAARIKESLRDKTRPRLDLFKKQLETEVFNGKSAFWDNKDNNYRNFLNQIQTEINLFQKDAETLQVAADLSFYNALFKRANELLDKIPNPGDVLNVIPWVVAGIALVAFFPLIRGFSSGGRALGAAPYRRRLATRF